MIMIEDSKTFFIFKNFVSYMKMINNLLARYYQETKERLKNRFVGGIKIFLKKWKKQ